MIFINNSLKINTFGGTHEDCTGAMIMGLPAGLSFDMDQVQDFLDRRRPGTGSLVSPRSESDEPIITSGMVSGDEAHGPHDFHGSQDSQDYHDPQVSRTLTTNGDPIRVIFKNNDIKNADADEDFVPRPGHGDFTYYKNTGKFQKGATSARATVGIAFAGALCKQYLSEKGIFISARRLSPDDSEIEKAKTSKDSIGGIVECTIHGLAAGFGNPFDAKIESSIAACIFNIPGVRGLEFGLGFEAAKLHGSEFNDPFILENSREVRTATNNCGGILGGMATGSPVVFRVAFKPTPSIAKEQQTVNLKTLAAVTIKSENRNDPCIAVRGTAVVEAAAAIAITDICLRDWFRTDHSHSCKSCSGMEILQDISADGQTSNANSEKSRCKSQRTGEING